MRPVKNAVFVEVNQRFLPYLEIFLKSLFRAYPDCPDVFVYHTDLTHAQLSRLVRHPAVRTVRLKYDDFTSGPPMATHRPKLADPRISYARFMIWTDRFKDYETVVHLDTDMLVAGRFDELFESDRFTIFAETYHADDALLYDPHDPELVRMLEEDGIRLPGIVANCGVFAVPRRDRTPENFRAMLDLLARYEKHIKWADQSIINLWMAKKGIPVSDGSRFNFQHRLILSPPCRRDLREARILHFNGVDLSTRLFLVRCADVLRRLPGGWSVYRMLYRAADGLLRLYRGMGHIGHGLSPNAMPRSVLVRHP